MFSVLEEQFVGSMLGLALADALGAKAEGGLIGGLIWRAAGGEAGGLLRWTDDTQMAVGLAESLVEHGGVDPDRLAKRWADGMEVMRGYGPGTTMLLGLVKAGVDWRKANRSVFREGSYGNGAAMRAAPLGLLYHRDQNRLRAMTAQASAITHAHPLGIEGAVLIASAVAMALQGDVQLDALREECTQEEYRGRLTRAKALLAGDAAAAQVRTELGNGIAAHESAVTAVYAFCRFPDDFGAMIDYVVELGGDTDTIGAMAGGIFGARHGARALPAELLARLEQRDRIEAIARRLHSLAGDA